MVNDGLKQPELTSRIINQVLPDYLKGNESIRHAIDAFVDARKRQEDADPANVVGHLAGLAASTKRKLGTEVRKCEQHLGETLADAHQNRGVSDEQKTHIMHAIQSVVDETVAQNSYYVGGKF